jgi:hypothetical protein
MSSVAGCWGPASDSDSTAAIVAYVPELGSAAFADVAVEDAFATGMAAVGDVAEIAHVAEAGVGDGDATAIVVLKAPGVLG